MNQARVDPAKDGLVVAGAAEEGEQKPVAKLLFNNNRQADCDNKGGVNKSFMMEIVADGSRSLMSD